MAILKDIRILIRAFPVFLVVFLLHRLLFWFTFSSELSHIDSGNILQSWWIGFRFDLRVILVFFLGFLGLSFLTHWGFKFTSRPERYLYPLQVGIMSLGLCFFLLIFWVDMGHYSYLSERLSSKVFALLTNLDITVQTAYQSYPLLRLFFGFVVCAALIIFIFLRVIFYNKPDQSGGDYGLKGTYRNRGDHLIFFPHRRYSWRDVLIGFVAFLFMMISIHSKFSQYPLRWSEAYFSKSNYINQFALNPLHNLFDTYKFSQITYREVDIVDEVEQVKADLGISDSKGALLVRPVVPQPLFKTPPHVVVIMMESLAAYKISAYGAPLNTTPNLDQIIRESLWFDNFHVSVIGTAASIFCFVTGIPDLNEEETASRNPLVVDQHTMINNFKDHDKYYFIGGDANWGNIRGILKNNIFGLNLLEEKDFVQGRADIWGISDLDLFEEAHKKFDSLHESGSGKRFFAFIQTSGYHMPHTIPKRTEGFEVLPLSEEHQKKYGFQSEKSYNSLRFSDHVLGYFFSLAKKSEYYKNTLFVIFGDHGRRIHFDAIQLGSFYRKHGFSSYHIPLVFHSPLLPESLKGKRDSILGYEPDILPTLQSMVGVEGVSTSFGLDLLSPATQQRRGIFLKGSGALQIRFFDGERIIYTGPDKTSQIKSYRTRDFLSQFRAHQVSLGSVDEQEDSVANSQVREFLNEDEDITEEVSSLARLARAYFKTIKYKLRNNQKEKVVSEKN